MCFDKVYLTNPYRYYEVKQNVVNYYFKMVL